MEKERVGKPTTFYVQRPVYEIKDLNTITSYTYEPEPYKERLRSKFGSCSPKTCIFKTIPILYWLPRYDWRKNIVGDVLSGTTVAIMHIPQGLAYGLLGNLPPIVGIYMAFYPVLIYCLFGTSRHVSIGTFAVVCLMTGKVVNEHAAEEGIDHNRMLFSNTTQYTNIQVATTVTFAVGIFHLIMCAFRLGIFTTLMSETLVNAFTCASAFHVVSAQLKDLFGLPYTASRGTFVIIKTVSDVIKTFPELNIAATTMSLIFVTAISLNNELFRPWLSRKTKVPFPIELIAIVVGTAVSHLGNFHAKFGLSVVGDIPSGLPTIDVPTFTLIPQIATDALVIAIVSYTVTISLGLIFAQKRHYQVDANQELFALGFSNCFGSLFSCMPVTASLARSMIQESVGGVTQIASIVSCLQLLVVLLWIGPIFETLPKCILGSIIVVSLKGMLVKVFSLKKYWMLSKFDFVVWVVTFLTTTLVAIDIGLGTGILMSILVILIQGYLPYACLLGVVPNTDIYLDIDRYRSVQELSGIKIFHYSGGLNFASKANYCTLLYRKLGFNPQSILTRRQEMKDVARESASYENSLIVKFIILDFAAVTYIDPSGVEMLRQIAGEYGQLDIEVCISMCAGPVFEMLKNCDSYEGKTSIFKIFPSIHDAVLYSKSIIG